MVNGAEIILSTFNHFSFPPTVPAYAGSTVIRHPINSAARFVIFAQKKWS